jgi:predicted GTPase
VNPARKVVILGAAGRDFHNFNVFFRDNPAYRVIAFTAAQIPAIAGRTYPPRLAGALYPDGIPVYPESELARLVSEARVNDVVFSYSDVRHKHVMHLASIALTNGASFRLLGPTDTMLVAPVPVVAVVAARTGGGKSTVTRHLHGALKDAGWHPVVVRHPMPYGRFDRGVECYRTPNDVVFGDLTIEEMEEYQPHVEHGAAVYAGVDYAAVLARAAAEADVILWDGGNNDMPFFRPDITLTIIDPLRPGQEDDYFPGEVNIRAADVLVVTKVNAASAAQVDAAILAAGALNGRAPTVRMALIESVDCPHLIRQQAVLAIEDGPSVTHGGLSEAIAARTARLLGGTLVDPRPYAVGSIARAYEQYPHIGPVLPALGYTAEQRDDLRRSIENVPCSAILLGTPADLGKLMRIARPVARVSAVANDLSPRSLTSIVRERLARH